MRDELSFFGFLARWWIALVVLGFLVGGGVWFVRVQMSDMIGKGNQKIQMNSSENRTFQYEHFLQLSHTIRTQSENAEGARSARTRFEGVHKDASQDNYATSQARQQMDSNVLGAEQICRETVNQYDTEMKSALRVKWVDSRLPQISTQVCTDPSRLPPALEGEENIH